MSRQLKLILFVLVFNAIGFAEGYLLSDLGARVGAANYRGDGGGSSAADSAGFMMARLMMVEIAFNPSHVYLDKIAISVPFF